MSLWRLYYHIVWATKSRQALILPEQECNLYDYIIGKSDSLGCIVHAINGITDHVHLIVSIPPRLAIYDYVRQIKGGSSPYMNQQLSLSNKFAWQKGYGIFSISFKNLAIAINYVNRQKEHHQHGTIIAVLEQTSDEENPPQRHYINPPNLPKL